MSEDLPKDNPAGIPFEQEPVGPAEAQPQSDPSQNITDYDPNPGGTDRPDWHPIQNVDKAHEIAVAVDDEYEQERDFLSKEPGEQLTPEEVEGISDDIENAVVSAARDYELSALGLSREQFEGLTKSNARALMDYGRQIFENQRKYGEQLSTGQQAFEAICEFYDRHPNAFEDESKPGNYTGHDMLYVHDGKEGSTTVVYVDRDTTSSLRLTVDFGNREEGTQRRKEIWHTSPMKFSRANSNEDGFYTLDVWAVSQEEGYSYVNTRTEKTRKITPEDVTKLKQLLDGIKTVETKRD